ncbi:hypothetical protein FOIG_10812 [Fusarium odoratissimum NRRL 54006]|uniref:Uncharacterized protein n=2 Tax=Fusarium oxysporum species complex TaxID=171631 RepID=X0JL58_FUSO5|nr:uncharacterized protein FOIG_10812 [Fusarium odoratissimum NRRL 54006]EXL97141.1 hypothetical protein FOIG_10812 [Fusarium odoratissimum NRRL 54006]TXC00751.1 hypothetical protein FocTR4_00009035 [Fusarium oxysporum f. sp. cubense]
MCYPEKTFAVLTSTHKLPEVSRIHVIMVRHGGNKGTPQTRGSVDDEQPGYTPFDETLGPSVISRPRKKVRKQEMNARRRDTLASKRNMFSWYCTSQLKRRK